jgi:N utilization substance protein B
MASNRHLGRIIALQSLYEYDFRLECGDATVDVDEIIHRNLERYDQTIEDKEFVTRLVKGAAGSLGELDKLLQPIAPEWPLEQIPRTDRTVLRMAIYELRNFKDVPAKVVINEAVELAKAFGNDNSSKFVNGVLGTAYRDLTSAETSKPPQKEE